MFKTCTQFRTAPRPKNKHVVIYTNWTGFCVVSIVVSLHPLLGEVSLLHWALFLKAPRSDINGSLYTL